MLRVVRRYSVLNKLPKVGAVKKNRFAEKYGAGGQPKAPAALPKNASQSNDYQRLRQKLRDNQRPPQQAQKVKGKALPKKAKAPSAKIKISVPTFVSAANLATILKVPLSEFLSRLEMLGYENAKYDYILDQESAALIADEFGFEIAMNDDTGLDLFPAPVFERKLRPRPPVVTIMGHVDHGKTTILDYLRKSSIVDQEHGGITQHIGAFSVVTPESKRRITFLDTPGHAAFLKMRERGANVTDIVILVVAADDSVMPQTIEAIKHAQKASVPMIVAINKCDKSDINVDKVLSDLARYGVDIEDYGGDTQTVRVSGKTGLNMDKLEEAVITLADIEDFKAEPKAVPVEGWVVESEVVPGLGNTATVLVRRGTLEKNKVLVAGTTYCKVRAMRNEFEKIEKKAGPSTPVQVTGWKKLPTAGDMCLEATNEKVAKKVVQNRKTREKQMQATKDMEKINERRQEEVKELKRQEKLNELKMAGVEVEAPVQEKQAVVLKYIIKSDVFGLAEAVKDSIDGLGNDEVKAVVVDHGAGPPTDLDVDTADALGAKILCFNVMPGRPTITRAESKGVTISAYNVIYHLIEMVTEELQAHLAPRIETKVLAEIDVKGVFVVTGKNKSKSKVAGCKVNLGVLKRASAVRVLRKGEVVFTGTLSSLKHVKDDISEAKKGMECGLTFDKWDKFEEGDVVEVYEEIKHQRYL